MRRASLFVVAIIIAACGGGETPPLDDAPPSCGPAPAGEGQVATQQGAVHGTLTGTTRAWKGVPFAAPPIGALRWKSPAEAACRTEILDASAFGPACVQRAGSGAQIGDEDCLRVNIWAREGTAASSAPVLVFIHGGGHQQGAASQTLDDGTPLYDGARLAASTGAVIVTLDYRLGPFGFLAHPALAAEGTGSGNYGMLDQIAALAWVRANIAGFGGDPAHVMVFGESAGAVSTCRLLVSPAASGLFVAAAIESGACVATPRADAEMRGTSVATTVGCTSGDIAACLRAVSVDALIATVMPTDETAGRQAYDGVIDGMIVPDAPLTVIASGNYNHVPTLMGSNTDEAGRTAPMVQDETQYEAAVAAYTRSIGVPNLAQDFLDHYPAASYPTPRAALVAMMTDVKFTCPTRRSIRALAAAQTEPVFRYVFGKVRDNASPQLAALGAFHGAELFYLYDIVGAAAGTPDRAVTDAMDAAWARTAATGDAGWPRYDLANDTHMLFDDTIGPASGFRNAQCDWLDSLR